MSMKNVKICTSMIVALVSALGSPIYAADKNQGEFIGAKITEYPSWFKESFLDFREDISEAKEANKRIMLFFHQDGCPYCNALVERNLAQIDIQQKIKKHFDVIAVNMWGDREVTYVDGKKYIEKTFAESLKVQFTPTLLFYNEDGKIILRLNGYRSPDRFNVELDYVAQKKETEIRARDYIKANMPRVTSSKKLHDEDFFAAPPHDFTTKKNNTQPFAVFFEQKDCPNCDTLHKKVLPDKETRNILSKFKVVQLDMWSKTPVVTPQGKKMSAKQWANELDVKFAPSIVVFNPDGKEVIRSEAQFKVFHTQSIFDYVLSGGYKKQPSFQRYLSERAEHLREMGRDVDIWRYADEAVGSGNK